MFIIKDSELQACTQAEHEVVDAAKDSRTYEHAFLLPS
jgi:hypothetical protein